MGMTTEQLAERIGAELVGDGGVQVDSVGPVEAAGESQVTFVIGDKHVNSLEKSAAAAVIVGGRLKGVSKPQLVVEDVNKALVLTCTSVPNNNAPLKSIRQGVIYRFLIASRQEVKWYSYSCSIRSISLSCG